MIPWQLLDNHAAQIVLMLVMLAWVAWLSRMVLGHEKALTELRLTVSNHYSTRFKQIAKLLKIEHWDGEDE